MSCSSTSITKHWEAELAALKGNNAKLTAALLESTANVKQWKQQLAAYQDEAERLHRRVRDRPLQIRSLSTARSDTVISTDDWSSSVWRDYNDEILIPITEARSV